MTESSGESLKFLVALLYAPGLKGKPGESIQGTTRLEKLAFLAQREFGFPGYYEFRAYDYGPWSAGVVDDADALKGVGLVEVTETPLAVTYPEGDEVVTERELSDREGTTGVGKLRTYKLSAAGHTAAAKVWQQLPGGERGRLESLKRAYNSAALSDLLRHVYEKYPETAVNSKIAATLSRRGTRPWLKPTKSD